MTTKFWYFPQIVNTRSGTTKFIRPWKPSRRATLEEKKHINGFSKSFMQTRRERILKQVRPIYFLLHTSEKITLIKAILVIGGARVDALKTKELHLFKRISFL